MDCQISSIVAAWVQACGAVIALGIAIWVAIRPEIISKRNSEIAAKHYLIMAEAAIAGLNLTLSANWSEESAVQKSRFLGELIDVQHIGQNIQLGQLSKNLCKDVLEARISVGRCINLGAEIDKYPQNLRAHYEGINEFNRDGYTIAFSLVKSSAVKMREINSKYEGT